MFLEVILPILVLLVVGLIGRKINLITPWIVKVLNKVAFYIGLPALVFYSIYSRTLAEIFSPFLILGFFATLFAMFGIGWITFKGVKDKAKKSISIAQSYHGNLGYMGLPIVTMAFGDIAGAKASLLLGLGSTTQIPLTIILLVHLNSIRTDTSHKIEQVATNPILIALILGLIFSFFSIPIAGTLDSLLAFLSEMALPIALLAVGASISIDKLGGKLRSVSGVVGSKLVLMPFLGCIILSILGVGAMDLRAGVLMLGMPTAVSTFIYAKELGGDPELASLSVSMTTVLSIISISVLLIIFG